MGIETGKDLNIDDRAMAVKRAKENVLKLREKYFKKQARKFVKELLLVSKKKLENNERLDKVWAIHQLIFETDFDLPFSWQGVDIQEDLGIVYLKFGSYRGYYRVFLVETEGRVETVAVAVQQYIHKAQRGNTILCVGTIKKSLHRHELQLQLEGCEKTENGWEIWHDGKMNIGSDIPKRTVLEAVTKRGREDLINNEYDKPWIYLGDLPNRSNATWEYSKEMLANLIYYALIRAELKDAGKTTKK